MESEPKEMHVLIIAFICGALGGAGAFLAGWGWWSFAAYLLAGWIGMGFAVLAQLGWFERSGD